MLIFSIAKAITVDLNLGKEGVNLEHLRGGIGYSSLLELHFLI